MLRRSCPLWVISGRPATSERCPLYPQKRTFCFVVASDGVPAKRQYKNLQASRLRLTGVHLLIRGTCWPDLRRADRFGHTVEDHDALTAAARRERFISAREATVDVLPVVDRPDVSCRIDGNIGLHLQTAA